MRSCRSKFLCCAGTALTAFSLAAASASAAAPATTRLGKRAAIPSTARPLGTLASGQRLTTTVTLAPRNAAALQSFVQSVSTPGAAGYHHYLTVGEFVQRFGPSSAQVAQVRSALQSGGLTLGALSPNHLSFTASGSARQISDAFHVTLRHYRLSSGRVGFAAGSAPAVPTSIASAVQGVLGLDTLVQAQRMSLKPAHPHAKGSGHGKGLDDHQLGRGGHAVQRGHDGRQRVRRLHAQPARRGLRLRRGLLGRRHGFGHERRALRARATPVDRHLRLPVVHGHERPRGEHHGRRRRGQRRGPG